MKRSWFLLLVLTLCLFIGFAHSEVQCNNASLQSKFGFAGMGLIPLPLKGGGLRYDSVSHMGLANYDGQGNVTVSVRVQFEGKTSPFTFTGIYALSSNCAGIATFKDSKGTVALLWEFVLVHGGEALETMALRPATDTRPMYSLTFRQEKQ